MNETVIHVGGDDLAEMLAGHWQKGAYGTDEAMCLHGAIRRCCPVPGDAYLIGEASAAARTADSAPREACDQSTVSEEGVVTGGKDSGSPATDQPIKVRLTVDLTDRTRVHEITEGGFWRYVTDELDPPERLIVRPGPAPSDRYEYPLDRVACVHMDPIGAKR